MSQPTRVNNNVFGVENCKIQPRDWTQVSYVEGRFFHHWAIREAHYEEPHVSPQFCKDAVLSLSHGGSTGWREFQVWFRFALWASGQVKGFSWGCLHPGPRCAFCPTGMFCPTWSRQRCSDVTTDTPHFHFFECSHFCKHHNFRAQLLGELSLRLPFLAARHCLSVSLE